MSPPPSNVRFPAWKRIYHRRAGSPACYLGINEGRTREQRQSREENAAPLPGDCDPGQAVKAAVPCQTDAVLHDSPPAGGAARALPAGSPRDEEGELLCFSDMATCGTSPHILHRF
ncbi:unnamed protein product [Lota lota]